MVLGGRLFDFRDGIFAAVTDAEREPIPIQILGAMTEASWLAVVVLVPWIFDSFGARAFAPWKALTLRALGAAAVLAFVARLVDPDVRARAAGRLRHPVFLAAFAFWVSTSLAVVSSVAFRKSVFGEYFQQGGWLTISALLGLFAVVALDLFRREQVCRLLWALVIGASGVAAYALAQRYGLDPIPWQTALQRPVSTLGNPIFLGGFLTVTLPVALALAARHLARRNWIPAGGFFAAAGLQTWALFLAASRGPWLALAAALWLGALIVSWVSAQRQLRVILTIAGVLGIAVVGLLAIGPEWMSPVRGLPGIGRFVGFARGGSTTSQTRLWVWEGAAGAATDSPLRLLIGHGPDTQQLVIPPHTPKALGTQEGRPVVTRAHNELWDLWVSRGLLGVVTWLVLVSLVVTTALKRFGSVQRKRLWISLAVGTAVGSGAGALFGVGLIPVGAMSGWFLALVVEVVREAFSGRDARAVPWISVGVLTALIAHVLEIQVGIATLASMLVFWVLAGLVVASERWPEVEEAPGRLARDAAGLLIVAGLAAFVVARYAWREPLTIELASSVDSIGEQLAAPVSSVAIAMAGVWVLAVVGLSLGRGPRGSAWMWPLLLLPPAGLTAAGIAGLAQPRADVIFKVARDDLHENRLPREAATLYEAALKRLPREDYYELFLGKALLDAGQLDPAESHLRRAYELSPLEPNTAYAMARYYRTKALQAPSAALRRDFLEQALSYFEQGARRQPFAVELWVDWALTLGELGRGEEGLEKIETLRKSMPDNANLYVFRGQIEGSMGRVDDAEASFEQALKLRPGLRTARRGLAVTRLATGDMTGAAELYVDLARRSPEDAELQAETARALVLAGDREGGLEYARKAAELEARYQALVDALEKAP